jgi:hypothetical protein
LAKHNNVNLKKTALGAVTPEGWLRDEMEQMSLLQKRLGSLGGLVRDGEWIRGEELPRYVRGLVLLSAALDDSALKEKLENFIQPILNSANAGGDLGPKKYRGTTPKTEAVKTLLSYYELTGDEKALNALRKFFKNQFNTLHLSSSWDSSRARLLEEIPAIEAVYRQTDLEWLTDLAEMLRDESNDWFKLCAKFNYKKPAVKYVSAAALKKLRKQIDAYEDIDLAAATPKLKPATPEFIESEWRRPAHQRMVETDVVNLAKAVKYPAVYGRLMGDAKLKELSLKLICALNKYHGTAAGMFTGSPYLAGSDAVMSVDVQAAVEYLESLTEVLAETGDFFVADLIERIVFNVVPAACLSEAGAVQDTLYLNQVETASKSDSDTKGYGNSFLRNKLSRGALAALSAYPLFMQTLCLQREGEINFLTYAPCSIKLNVGGAQLVLKEETGYPFRNTIVFTVDQADARVETQMNFRVPAGTVMQLVSGGQVVATSTKNISVKCVLSAGSTFTLKLNIPLYAADNNDNSVSLYKGSLLMAANLPFEGGADKDDKDVLRFAFSKKWNIAPELGKKSSGGVKKTFETEKTVVNPLTETPFSFVKPPFELKIRSKNVLNWEYNVDGLAEIPSSPEFSEESLERSYIPFGCSIIRMAQFPKCLK